MRKSKKAQVWIETVIYTLIAFVMIGTVLSFVKPKIEEIQDKAIIEQTIGMLEQINTQILSIKGVSGNKRLLDLEVKKGNLIIDGESDLIIFEIESKHVYSEPGEDVNVGALMAHTEKKGKFNLVTITSDYNEYNITYRERDVIKTINRATTPYKLSIENKGENGRVVIDIDLI